MFNNYAPLSTAVSAFLPDNLDCVLAGAEISVSGFYIKDGVPHIVLKHPYWQSRAHFIIRWILHQDQGCTALLEQVTRSPTKVGERQIFVRVNDHTTVTFISQPEFMRVLQLVCSDIVAQRLINQSEKNRKLLDDVNRIFRRVRSKQQSISRGICEIQLVAGRR